MAPLTVMVIAAGRQQGTPDPGGPTAIEQALIEHACSGTRPARAPETDAYQDCLSSQLLSMRADLGRDLTGLSASERKALDSACGDIRTAGGRESYLECLSTRLVSLRNRRNRAKPAPLDGTALAPPVVIASAASAAPAARPASSWSFGLWIGAAFLTLFVAACGVFLLVRARRVQPTCRVCGADLSESGDLCQKCRHEAAEAVRSAAMERDQQQRAQRAQEEEQRRQSEHGEEQRRQNARQEDAEAGLRQQQAVRQREEDAREQDADAQQRQEEEARQRSQHAVVSGEELDPYAVLGVPRDASTEDIGAAYQEARLKYDPDHVTHLSIDVQEHYRAKAEAVDRAYLKLSESH